MISQASTLCFTGVLLFFLGLSIGFGIPAFRSPRIGLSAHVGTIESGLGLIGFGLLWPHLAMSETWGAAIAHTLWISFYVLSVGLVVGAIYGTGKTLPIAGQGLTASASQESLARVLISVGAVGSFLAVLGVLVLWGWK